MKEIGLNATLVETFEQNVCFRTSVLKPVIVAVFWGLGNQEYSLAAVVRH